MQRKECFLLSCQNCRKRCFSGPLASFVGKNFDTRQDACWGQLRDEAVSAPLSPLVNSRRFDEVREKVLATRTD